ncbi:Imidazole glycerol phosphate synthase subunit HisH [Candidatus Magnetomoraceae bacterium gMMP-13]
MIAIIDYDAGNLTSVARAVTHLGFSCSVTADPLKIQDAERIIFPGVGAAGSAMESLRSLKLDIAINDSFTNGKPILGICLGTQIILRHSQENNAECIGLVNGEVRSFSKNMKENGDALKVPHMGWNRIKILKKHPVLAGVKPEHEFYFVHSYYPDPEDENHVIAVTEYGIKFTSILGYKNLIATQFHPEKSGRPGLSVLKNFCNWNP